MEMTRKFVIYDLVNKTMLPLDYDRDNKISFFEFIFAIRNSSFQFPTIFTNLLTMVVEEELLALYTNIDDETDYEELEEDDLDFDFGNDVNDESISVNDYQRKVLQKSINLLKKARRINDTVLFYGFFLRLDVNSDGFITKVNARYIVNLHKSISNMQSF